MSGGWEGATSDGGCIGPVRIKDGELIRLGSGQISNLFIGFVKLIISLVTVVYI